MTLVLWILQVLLALAFVGAGFTKLTQSKSQLVTMPPMAWANDFSPSAIRLIGLAEVVGALGLVLPAALGVLPWLTPLAAFALALLMGGAVVTHVQRSEAAVPSLVLGFLSLALAAGRFWLQPL